MELKNVLVELEKGNIEPLKEAAAEIKSLPRTEEGIFDMSAVDKDCFVAATAVYPVYAAFETECNKEAGYPDLLAQIKVLEKKQEEAASLQVTAQFLEMLLTTIDYVTPQLYEYYRSLVDIFRADVTKAISTYYKEGAFGGEEGKKSGADRQLRETIRHAGETYVLLDEKYRLYQ